ncbi:MAG: hypothetical protein GXP25_16115, partial [Planctomycetes bacterium]|nr:hypothetical protein [Planctomycetota bacterium]
AFVWFALAMAFLVVAGGFIKIGEWLYFHAKRGRFTQRSDAPRRVGLARCVLDFLM